MNHLRRFNESDEFIIPIDVESDVKEFRNKFFTEDIKRRFGVRSSMHLSTSVAQNIERKLNELESQHPTMTDKYQMFQIHNVNDPIECMVIVRAVSSDHAFIKAALALNTGDVAYQRLGRGNPSRWKCNIVTIDNIKQQIDNCVLKLEKLKDIR